MAYNTATLIRKDPSLDNGQVWITVQFTGNAGEPPIRQRYLVGHTDTGQTIRQWAIGVANALGSAKNIADSLTVGQSVNLTPISDPPPTAQQVWRGKVSRYLSLSAVPWSGALATDLAALKSNIETTYVTGYL